MAIKLWSVNELSYKVGSEPNHQPKSKSLQKKKRRKKKTIAPPYPRDIRRAEAWYGLRNMTAIKSFCPYGFT